MSQAKHKNAAIPNPESCVSDAEGIFRGLRSICTLTFREGKQQHPARRGQKHYFVNVGGPSARAMGLWKGFALLL